MFKFRFLVIFMAVMPVMLFSQVLDFSKKSGYHLGEGEYGSITLELKNHETFDYQSEVKKPFVMKKLAGGKIELIYDTRTLSAEEMQTGKTFKSSFMFVKKNIGKKEYLNVSAVLMPELRILVNDSIPRDFINLNFTPDKKSFTIAIEASKDIGRIQSDIPDGVVSFGDTGALSFVKGRNEITITLTKEQNFNEEISIFRNASEGRINELFFLVNSSGFKLAAAVKDTEPEQDVTDTTDTMNLYADIDAGSEISGDESQDITAQGSGGFGTIPIIIISVLLVVIIVLLIALSKNKKGAMYEKYETFFDDVATLVKVNIKGVNIDKSIEEIMMILLDKFDYSSAPQPAEPKQETKKALKKPSNLKSPAVVQKDDDADLDFGGRKIEIKPSEKKTDTAQNGEKKMSRGFDFLDEDN
jgi:hypothetical protein